LGYTDYIKQMLAPLGIYDLETGVGAEELEVIGEELDKVFYALEEVWREAVLATAQSYGLKKYEEILPYRPAYITAEDERRAVMALLRIRGGCFTISVLQDTLSGCGITATVEEGSEKMSVVVKFPNNKGIPDSFEKLKARIEEILPCHLNVKYEFIYSAWQIIMDKLNNWAAVERNAKSWREFEIYE